MDRLLTTSCCPAPLRHHPEASQRLASGVSNGIPSPCRAVSSSTVRFRRTLAIRAQYHSNLSSFMKQHPPHLKTPVYQTPCLHVAQVSGTLQDVHRHTAATLPRPCSFHGHDKQTELLFMEGLLISSNGFMTNLSEKTCEFSIFKLYVQLILV